MVAVQVAEGPIRSPRCSQQLYKCAQTQWTGRLFVQMTLYVIFLAISTGVGGMMPWVLQHSHATLHAGAVTPALQKVYKEQPGYTYINSNTYSYCSGKPQAADSLPRGYPAAPLSPQGSKLLDAWQHQPVTLKGISWPGFNRRPTGLEGLGGAQSAMEATDFRAIVYQLKLLGFNTVKLPFSFQALKAQAAKQTHPCKHSDKAAWAQRAVDPSHKGALDMGTLLNPSVHIEVRNGSCNSYLPSTTGLGRLLWTMRYLVANGFYVALSYEPGPGEVVHHDKDVFALAWLSLWTPITCLDTFSADIRGRLLLDLLNEPSRLDGGVGWSSDGPELPNSQSPGLTQLYLAAMDAIEGITPRDALFMVQGSAVSAHVATEAGGGINAYGLSPGDGFVLDESAITAYQLSDPRPFLSQLLQRPYSNRVMLAPHLLGPDSSGAVWDSPEELVAKMNSSWGQLASEGFCNGTTCFRLPVLAGEIGSHLGNDQEVQYYDAIAAYAGLKAAEAAGAQPAQHLSGWIWSGYSNVSGPGPLLKDNWARYDWVALRYLSNNLGLQPWYRNSTEWLRNCQAQKQAAADAAAAAAAAAVKADIAAAAAAAAAGARPAEHPIDALHDAGSLPSTLERLYERAAADKDLQQSAVLPALAEAAAAANATQHAPPAADLVSSSSSSSSVDAPSGARSPPAPEAVFASPVPVEVAPVPAPAPAAVPAAPSPATSTGAPPTAPSPAPSSMGGTAGESTGMLLGAAAVPPTTQPAEQKALTDSRGTQRSEHSSSGSSSDRGLVVSGGEGNSGSSNGASKVSGSSKDSSSPPPAAPATLEEHPTDSPHPLQGVGPTAVQVPTTVPAAALATTPGLSPPTFQQAGTPGPTTTAEQSKTPKQPDPAASSADATERQKQSRDQQQQPQQQQQQQQPQQQAQPFQPHEIDAYDRLKLSQEQHQAPLPLPLPQPLAQQHQQQAGQQQKGPEPVDQSPTAHQTQQQQQQPQQQHPAAALVPDAYDRLKTSQDKQPQERQGQQLQQSQQEQQQQVQQLQSHLQRQQQAVQQQGQQQLQQQQPQQLRPVPTFHVGEQKEDLMVPAGPDPVTMDSIDALTRSLWNMGQRRVSQPAHADDD